MNDDNTDQTSTVGSSAVRKSSSTSLSDARRSKVLHAIFVVLAVGIIGFGGGWLGAASQRDDSLSHAAGTQRVVLDEQSNLISAIADEVGKSVVSVTVMSQTSNDPYATFFGFGNTQQESAGTGIILSSDGLIITNRHVVPKGTTNVNVTLSDGTEFKDVEVVGRTNPNDSLDVAFLKIKDLGGKKLTPAKLGESNKMRVGDSVVAIGNALGQFQNTVTSGIISGYGRSVEASDSSGGGSESLDNLFQTDAAINAGNSGGPLVNLNGEVIGINTAVASGGAENIGFAIPIDNVKGLINSVEKTGKLERPYIGVVYVTLTDDIAKQYSLSVSRGAYIPQSSDYGQQTILADGPAAKAGIKEGDVITKVDNTDINEKNSLASVLGKRQPNDKVKVELNRSGDKKTVEVTLGTMPDNLRG